ncbi:MULTISPECIES: haloacid dehalogenase type II [Methylomonas]|uniref:haloacid dehalogenase type II n=1 Tax=Methylomonas TaxID=416 RepID=UPI0012321AD1|nr:haloacid dehalogenase type II [Methylomonas rhizoryzae]
MPLTRRRFLALTSATAGAALSPSLIKAGGTAAPTIKAIAFDAFTVFDPRPVAAATERRFPGRGSELSALWRSRQFEYSWLRTLGGRYTGFRSITAQALSYAANALGLPLADSDRDDLVAVFEQLPAWPDARPVLSELRERGIRLAFLSNLPEAILLKLSRDNDLQALFDPPLSTDRVSAFKPDPRAYAMALNAFGLTKQEIAFAAFGAWDAVGAAWFGYPTAWINRQHLPLEQLEQMPAKIGPDLTTLLEMTQTAQI